MEYGRLVVLGYSSYRVASTRPADMVDGRHSTSSADADDMARSPVGVITSQQKKTEKDRRTIGQLWEPIGDQNAEYVLVKRKKGNGVKLHRFHHFMDARLRNPETESTDTSGKTDLKILTRRLLNAIEIRNKALQHTGTRSSSSEEEELLSPSWSTSSASSSSRVEPRDPVLPPSPSPCSFLMCIPMNDADAHASVTEYVADDTTDMFQIGRMPCRQNDVVIPGPRVGASGTISRFAARIVCQRDAPYECHLFAGGFDVGQKMTTAGHALKRCGKCGEWLKRVDADHKCIHDLMDEGFGHSNQRELHGDRVDHSSDASVPGIMDLEHIEMEMNNPANVPIDGLTKNGVRVWLPEEKKWFEVSVNGNLYGIAPRTPSMSSMRGRRASLNPDTSVRHSAFNRPTGGVANVPALLTDGAIIDLGGVQLQFQVPRRHEQGTDEDDDLVRASMALVDEVAGRTGDTIDSSVAAKMDKLNVHCPVQLHPLRFDRSSSEEDIDLRHVPHVFPACGHVFGYEKRLVKSKICPLCRKPGNLVRLRLKENFQLMPRAERTAVPECVFNPCGHAISHSLATHYSGLVMPNGRAICPFCAVHLDAKTPFSQLYLYSEGDSN